jgi:transposase-like protein
LQDAFLTVAEIAKQLKLNPQTIRNWIDQGSLPAVRVALAASGFANQISTRS